MSYLRSKFRHPALPKNDLVYVLNLITAGDCFYVGNNFDFAR